MSTTTNISSVVSPDILKTISSSTVIKTLGNQLKDKAKETVISVFKNKVGDLEGQIEGIVKAEIQAGLDHNYELKRLKELYDNKQITEEEYNKAVASENESYNILIAEYKLQVQKLQEDIQNILNDPYKKIKNQQVSFKKRIRNLKKQTQNSENQSKRDLAKQVASNAVKTLAPIIALQITNQLSNIVFQRKKLEDLVDQVNNYITTQVKDQQTVTIAINLRNNAISLINNNIKKLNNLEKTLKTITKIIIIFSLILKVLSLIPYPIPPKVIITLEKANKLVSALSAILAIANMLLINEINKLEELKNRLKEISLRIDGSALNNLDNQQLLDLTNTTNQFPTYKGFNFKIKEEQNLQFVVKGNKRHYAVAVDRYGTEIIKSEYSFTLDPQDLVDQLKLVIDQQNLQG